MNERPPGKVHPQFDSEAALKEARSRMSFEQVLQQYGHGPKNGGNLRSFPCPFCTKKNKAGLFKPKGETHQLFKCHSTSCPSGAEAMDEVGFIARVASLSRKDAFQAYLKQAGVWKERTTLKSPPAPRPATAQPDAATEDEPTSEEVAAAFAQEGDVLSSPGTSDHHASPEPAVGEADSPVDELPTAESAPSREDSSAPPAIPPNADLSAGDSQPPVPASNIVPLREPHPDSADSAKGTVDGAQPAAADVVVKPVEVVREFYDKLQWSEKHERACWEKRGLETRTCVALGFRSNPKTNKALLLDLRLNFEEEMLLDSGLWTRDKSSGKPKPSGKFWGWGRKSNVMLVDEDGTAHVDETMEYEQSEPILIPYFNHLGELISLRPHKDMGPKGTTTGRPHLYVPRAQRSVLDAEGRPKGKREFFTTVVVTEGEFKAAALWQIVGPGRNDGRKPMGVCAVPGISFGRNYDIGEELEVFLRQSAAEHLIVVFDNEDKATEKLPPTKEFPNGEPHPAYKKDWQKRHDAEIWARYLAEEFFIRMEGRLKTAKVGRISNEWRNEKGKADWDGMMGTIAKEGTAA